MLWVQVMMMSLMTKGAILLTKDSIVFLNHRFLPASQASIPITDRGFLFGDGIFTTIRVENGEPEHLERHLSRVKKQCIELKIDSPEISKEWLAQLIEKNHAQSGIWRMKIIVTGGDSSALNLEKRKFGNLLITISPYEPPIDPYRLTVYPYPIVSPVADLKSLSYLQRLHVKEYARQHGCDDAIVLSPEGFILETAFGNFCWILEDCLYVPDPELPLFEGITISVLQEKMQTKKVKSRIEDIPKEAKCYLCNTMIGCHPIEIDRMSI